MYNVEALKRKIQKEGLQPTIILLSSPDFPKSIKEDLTKDRIFVGGYPNISLISSLA